MKSSRRLFASSLSFAYPLPPHYAPNRLLSLSFSSSSSSSSEEVRVRFAPSPTGHLHLGGLRTALYNFLFAKKHGGSFIMRVEDTDQTRVVPGALEALIEDLRWTGITIDEGPGSVSGVDGAGGSHGPYVQSDRLSIYKEKGEEIVDRGGAYRCFCTEHRLDLMKKDVARRNEHFRGYDNRCRHLSASEISDRLRDGVPHVTRLRLVDDVISYDDAIFGPTIDKGIAQREGDPILIKSDGYPTYHFANVVDDRLMRVSHVLRGAEWISSTSKHIMLYKAFDWTPPRFAHLPLIMNSDGKKLSKRHDHLRVSSLRASGYTPETVLTFLCSIGGGILPRIRKEFAVYSLESLVEAFELAEISRSPGSLNFDLMGHYSRSHHCDLLSSSSGRDRLFASLKEYLLKTVDASALEEDEELMRILQWSVVAGRIVTVKGLVDDPDLSFVWQRPVLDLSSIAHVLDKNGTSKHDLLLTLQRVTTVIRENHDLNELNVDIKALIKKRQNSFMPFKDLMVVMRWCLMGGGVGPPVFEIIDIITKERALRRMDAAIDFLAKNMDADSTNLGKSVGG